MLLGHYIKLRFWKCNKMAFQSWFSMLVLCNVLLDCSSAAVHGHVETVERESDGSYRPRDSDHYGDEGHNVEFDHESILGSVKEAEEYDKLSPEESKQRLAELLPRMDLNGDLHIDRAELKKWILSSFRNLSKEEAGERLSEADYNKDGAVTWGEYLQDTFGVDSEEEVASDDTADSGLGYPVSGLVSEEKAMWKVADSNGDGVLDAEEFEVFSNPEEHEAMHPFLVRQALREKDKNGDGKIDFQEYMGERGIHKDREWLLSERDKFDHELDLNNDGILDHKEVHKWVIPDNDDIATEEVDHLFAAADDDHDDLLSFDEILEHHDVFVGSEATDYGNDLMGEHFDDEL